MSLKSVYFGEPKLYRKSDMKPTVILLMGAIIPSLQRYLGMFDMYSTGSYSKVALHDSADLFAVNFFFISAFILMGIIPFILMKYYLKEDLKTFGLQIGDWRTGWKTVIVLFPVIALALLLPAAFQKDFNQFYPLAKAAHDGVLNFVGHELMRGIFYYTAWEFFFRGFMLFGLREHIGDWNAILVQTIASCLWHVGYPPGEILMSIPAGILFGAMAIKTRSIIWPFLLHWLIGVAMDGFIVLTK